MFKRHLRTFGLLSCSLLAVAAAGRGQDTTQLIFNVRDAQGAAVPGASIVIRQAGCPCNTCPSSMTCSSGCCNCQGGDCRCCIDSLQTQTDEEGRASFSVPTGRYSARVTVSGFKDSVLEDIEATVGGTKVVEVSLDPGSVSEQVVVSSPAPAAAKASPAAETAKLSLTVEGENDADREEITVQVVQAGCVCNICPASVTCLSGCCDCRGGDCRCCIDTSATINPDGTANFTLPKGRYNVTLIKDGKSFGTLLGVRLAGGGLKLKAKVEDTAK